MWKHQGETPLRSERGIISTTRQAAEDPSAAPPFRDQALKFRRIRLEDIPAANGRTGLDPQAPFKCERARARHAAVCAGHRIHRETGTSRYCPKPRRQRVGMDPPVAGKARHFPWVSEMIDGTRGKNFFETRVADCQTGCAPSRG
jgi:hypothetical protein